MAQGTNRCGLDTVFRPQFLRARSRHDSTAGSAREDTATLVVLRAVGRLTQLVAGFLVSGPQKPNAYGIHRRGIAERYDAQAHSQGDEFGSNSGGGRSVPPSGSNSGTVVHGGAAP